MIIRSVLCCAAMMAYATSTWGAGKPTPDTVAKAASKPAQKKAAKPVPRHPVGARAKAIKNTPKPIRTVQGKTETLTCRDGTEDRHARIGVVLVGGRVDNFAYYSKWKPRTCSIYLRRAGDSYSKWVDKGSVTNINLERGLLMVEHGKGEYRFVFRDIDRERYCGMDGTINGTLTIRKGTERCELTGVMEEGVPLGQAYAHAESALPAAVSPAVATAVSPVVAAETPPPKRFFQWVRRQDDSPFPTPTAGPGD